MNEIAVRSLEDFFLNEADKVLGLTEPYHSLIYLKYKNAATVFDDPVPLESVKDFISKLGKIERVDLLYPIRKQMGITNETPENILKTVGFYLILNGGLYFRRVKADPKEPNFVIFGRAEGTEPTVRGLPPLVRESLEANKIKRLPYAAKIWEEEKEQPKVEPEKPNIWLGD